MFTLRVAAKKSQDTANVSEAPAIEQLAGPGLPTNFRGRYELFAVVTHEVRDGLDQVNAPNSIFEFTRARTHAHTQGASADGGHYMGWVRQSGDKWLCFDDDEVDACETHHVLKLKTNASQRGQAYLTFYRFKE